MEAFATTVWKGKGSTYQLEGIWVSLSIVLSLNLRYKIPISDAL